MAAVYFGEPWDAPILDGATQVEVPTYAACLRCDEPIADGDRGLVLPYVADTIDPRHQVRSGTGCYLVAVHLECHLASVVGHSFGVCPCTGYGSTREAAREVARRVQTAGGAP